MVLCGADLCFAPPAVQKTREELEAEDEVPLEIDYDSPELTLLYQAIEDKAFMAAIDFLESGKPEVYDECRTWVTRYEKENQKKIRWSQLPLHAAIVFGAPPKLIQLLVQTYPKAVRCTDDRVMLPIHLAFKKEAGDSVIHCLLKEFPESVNAKDSRGRTPLQVQPSQKAEIISVFEENAKAKARKALTDEKVSGVQKKLIVVEQLNSDLQNKNERLEEENRALKDQIETLTVEIEDLKDAEPQKLTRSFSLRSNKSMDKKSSQENSQAAQSPQKVSPIKKLFGRMKAGNKNTSVTDNSTKEVTKVDANSNTQGVATESEIGVNEKKSNEIIEESAPVVASKTPEKIQKKSIFKNFFPRSKDTSTKSGLKSNSAAASPTILDQGDLKVIEQGAGENEKTSTIAGSDDEQEKADSTTLNLPRVETVVSEQGSIVAEPMIPIAAAGQ
jgi:Ankyrin repeats (many copies)